MTNEQLMKQQDRNRKRIMRLVAIERNARSLNDRLGMCRIGWRDLHAKVRDTDEWAEYCDNHGIAPDYNFGDILA